MPIRFIDAYGRLGRSAVTLDDIDGALEGVFSEPAVFTGPLAQRLDDLSGHVVASYQLSSARTGVISRTLAGATGRITGTAYLNPLLPPASVTLVFL